MTTDPPVASPRYHLLSQKFTVSLQQTWHTGLGVSKFTFPPLVSCFFFFLFFFKSSLPPLLVLFRRTHLTLVKISEQPLQERTLRVGCTALNSGMYRWGSLGNFHIDGFLLFGENICYSPQIVLQSVGKSSKRLQHYNKPRPGLLTGEKTSDPDRILCKAAQWFL